MPTAGVKPPPPDEDSQPKRKKTQVLPLLTGTQAGENRKSELLTKFDRELSDEATRCATRRGASAIDETDFDISYRYLTSTSRAAKFKSFIASLAVFVGGAVLGISINVVTSPGTGASKSPWLIAGGSGAIICLLGEAIRHWG